MESFWDKDFAVDVIYRSMRLVHDIRSRSSWKLKADGTLLTEVDPANEEFLRRELCKNGELFIGEESIEREGNRVERNGPALDRLAEQRDECSGRDDGEYHAHDAAFLSTGASSV